jgi:hypothetical protein
MNSNVFDKFREGVSCAATALGAGGVWGSLAAISSRLLTPISEAHSWLFVGLPVAVVVIALIWRRLPKILGFRGE